MSPDPDIDELLAWRAGNRRAGNHLVSKYYPMVYRFFDQRVGGDVADLVQNTFLACVRARDSFNEHATFRTFLYAIARRQLLMNLRERYRSGGQALDSSITSLADLGISPTQVLRDQQQARLIYEAMRRLPIDHQMLLELFYWERLTAPELAEVFDVPENTVRSRLRRARVLLRNNLDELARDPSGLGHSVHGLDDLVARLREEVQARFPGLVADEAVDVDVEDGHG